MALVTIAVANRGKCCKKYNPRLEQTFLTIPAGGGVQFIQNSITRKENMSEKLHNAEKDQSPSVDLDGAVGDVYIGPDGDWVNRYQAQQEQHESERNQLPDELPSDMGHAAMLPELEDQPVSTPDAVSEASRQSAESSKDTIPAELEKVMKDMQAEITALRAELAAVKEKQLPDFILEDIIYGRTDPELLADNLPELNASGYHINADELITQVDRNTVTNNYKEFLDAGVSPDKVTDLIDPRLLVGGVITDILAAGGNINDIVSRIKDPRQIVYNLGILQPAGANINEEELVSKLSKFDLRKGDPVRDKLLAAGVPEELIERRYAELKNQSN